MRINKVPTASKLHMLKPIFARPFLAAALVGSFIHMGKWINYTLHDVSYLNSVVQELNNGIVFFTIDLLMPYLVPFAVITISGKLAKLREQEFYHTFPDLNPDIVIKCDASSTPMYVNTAAKKLLADNNLPVEDVSALIPTLLLSNSNDDIDFPCRIIHEVNHESIEYLICLSDDGSLFLSGRVLKK